MNNQIPVENKMEKHLTIVAALQVGLSVMAIIAAIVVFTVLQSIMQFADEPEAKQVISIVTLWVPVFLLIISIPGLIGGIGLFLKQKWARILVLVISVLELLNIPLGTAVGVYSIWVLVQEDTIKLFTEQSLES